MVLLPSSKIKRIWYNVVMKTLDWIKWVGATVIAAVSMTVTSLSYFDSQYGSKETVTTLEKRFDSLESEIHADIKELQKDIKELIKHGRKDSARRQTSGD